MAHRPIRTVTVAGITGALGPAIVNTLHSAGFVVQALTRRRISAAHLPANIVEVDYTSPNCLASVLEGQDAVVSCLGDTAPAVAAQRALIQASLRSKVKRFIPSEFGSNTTHERVKSFPFFRAKLEHQHLLRLASERRPDFSYSLLITGPLLDWGLSIVPFILNVGSVSGDIYDNGTVPFSITRTPAVAKAVASILFKPSSTANRTLFVHEAVVTQNLLIRHAAYQASRPFFRRNVSTAQLEARAWRAFTSCSSSSSSSSGNAVDPLEWILPFINLSIWSRDQLCHFHRTDNALLGVRELKDDALEAMVADEVRVARALLAPPVSAMAMPGEEVSAAGRANVEAIEIGARLAERAYEDGKRKLVLM